MKAKTTVNAFAAYEAKANLKPFTYEAEQLGPHDLQVSIDFCGVCHSDVHLIDNDWRVSQYPLVPGHEIVGRVTAKGHAVTDLKEGDRVGIGWQRGSCMHCEDCVNGNENYCPENQATCLGHYGGFASHIVVDSRFAFHLPEALSSEHTAPLLCGGVTVFSPLDHFGAGHGKRVGVIGIGGLGHLAVQFAAKMGSEVTAFSTNASKRDECRELGASSFVDISGGYASIKPRSCDLIISTVHHNLDWSQFVGALRPEGTLCFVGIPSKPLEISVGQLLGGRKRVAASPIGSPGTIRKMLDFAAKNYVQATIESYVTGDINKAIDRTRSGKARYRSVVRING